MCVCLRTRVSSKPFQLSIINLNYDTISLISGQQVEKEPFKKKTTKTVINIIQEILNYQRNTERTASGPRLFDMMYRSGNNH